MFGLGIWEIVVILTVALLVLGPDKLPQVARQLARLLGEVRKFSDDVRRQVDDVIAEPQPPKPGQGLHTSAQQAATTSTPDAACDPAFTKIPETVASTLPQKRTLKAPEAPSTPPGTSEHV